MLITLSVICAIISLICGALSLYTLRQLKMEIDAKEKEAKLKRMMSDDLK